MSIKNLKLPPSLLYITIIISLLTLSLSKQTNNSQTSIQCILQDKITNQCILNINKNAIKLVQKQPSYSMLLCPVFVKFYEQNQQYRTQLWENTQKVCKLSTQDNIDNGYLLLGLYAINQKYIEMLELQYGLFFRQPFTHQKKFKETLEKYSKYFNLKQVTQEDIRSYAFVNFSTGIKLFYQNNLTESLKYLELLHNIPSQKLNNFLVFLTTRILQKNGQFPQALQMLQKNITKSGNNAHWYFYHLKGNLLMHHLMFKQAIRSFQQALNIKTSKLKQEQFLFSLYNIGVCYQKIGEFGKSLQYFKMIVDKRQVVQALNSLAFSYYSLIDLEDTNKKNKNQQYVRLAQKMYKRAIKSDKNYHIAYYNYATLMFDIGNYKLAKQLYSQSISQNSLISSSTLSSKYGLFKSFYKIDKAKALQYLQKEILTIIGFQSLFGDIGSLFHQLDQKQQAKKYLQKAIEVGYNLGQVYQEKGVVQFQLGLKQQAIASLLKALEHGNIKASVWFNLGYLYQLNNNYQKALGLYKKSLQKDPKSPAKQRIQQLIKILQKSKKQQL